ncbi:uncharacterized protein LOC134622792 [Pelmatolapia mariae]|uniref:uncharacterized protein LOC134620572 n=1 Tax=Pelmatolapia mariae TaxID=158779 RepID=UPI003211D670
MELDITTTAEELAVNWKKENSNQEVAVIEKKENSNQEVAVIEKKDNSTQGPSDDDEIGMRMTEAEIKVLGKLKPMVTQDFFQYAENLMKKKSVNHNELMILCNYFVEQLQQARKGKNQNPPWLRMHPTVKVYTVVTGRTFGIETSIMNQVKKQKFTRKSVEETTSLKDCDVIMVFCPITSRIVSDVAAALRREEVSLSDKPVILVLMHHTRDVKYSTGGRNRAELGPKVKLQVDVLFHDTQRGLLDCDKNKHLFGQGAHMQYSKTELLAVLNHKNLHTFADNDWDSIPPEIQTVTDSNFTIPPLKWRRRRRHRKQKRGKRTGLKARLRATPHGPAIPSLFLTNSRSLNNKMDELRLQITSRCLDCCVMIITETLLDSFTPDTAIELEGHATFRADRRNAGEVC